MGRGGEGGRGGGGRGGGGRGGGGRGGEGHRGEQSKFMGTHEDTTIYVQTPDKNSKHNAGIDWFVFPLTKNPKRLQK